jgi:hypothetical protein
VSCGREEVPLEPLARQSCHFVEGSRLLEEMRRPRDDYQLLFAMEFGQRDPIQLAMLYGSMANWF